MITAAACGSGDDEEIPELDDPLASAGREVFEKQCARCHSLEEDKVIIGPSLNGVANHAPTRVEGMDAYEYVHSSVTKPSFYLVEGFNDLMPTNFQALLSDEELESVIAYILTLR